MPVPSLVAVTSTPGIKAPAASTTVPPSRAFWDCAHAPVNAPRNNNATNTVTRSIFMPSSTPWAEMNDDICWNLSGRALYTGRSEGSINHMMRYVPLIGITAIFLIGIGGRAWLQRRRYGSWGIVLLRSKELGQRLRDAALLLLGLLVVGQSVWFALSPEMIFGRMLISPRNFSGIILLVCGVVLMTQAQLHLG